MPMFDSILFDFDGVLADTEPVHCLCWSEVLAPEGVALDWGVYSERFVGIDDREVLRILAAEAKPPREWADFWALYPAKRERFRSLVRTAPPFDPALGPFLQKLRQRYRLAVVSSSSSTEIEPILEAGGLRHHFETVVGGDHVKAHKPSPEAYLLGAERLGVKNPLVVEDSPAGQAAGRAAGFEVLMVPHPREVPALVSRRLAL